MTEPHSFCWPSVSSASTAIIGHITSIPPLLRHVPPSKTGRRGLRLVAHSHPSKELERDHNGTPAAAASNAKFGVPRPVNCRQTNSKDSLAQPYYRAIPRTHRIPSGNDRESTRSASRIASTHCDIIERRCRSPVQERVQETQPRPPHCNTPVVQQHHRRREHWQCRG